MPRPQFPPRTHRAREALDAFGRAYPDVWRAVDQARADRSRHWPPYVFLPLEQAGAIAAPYLSERMRGSKPELLRAATVLASHLTLFASWRLTQGVFRFDPALYTALVQTPIAGEIPGELLRRLPHWCVYVETPDMTAPLVGGGSTRLYGTWAWLDHLASESLDILTLGLDTGEHLAIGHVPLVGTLEDALDQVEADWTSAVARGNAATPPQGYALAARAMFGPLLSLLLYLCADEADLSGQLANPRPKRTKSGWRLFPADRLTTWDVGVRIGAALRRAYQQAETEQQELLETGRARPRAHVRRAHWHTFLAGAGRTERRVRWIPPITVNIGYEPLPAVIREVRDE